MDGLFETVLTHPRRKETVDLMDIEVVRTFLAVVETRNFNRAAGLLNVTQSTVSMRIKALEDILGRTVFLRNRSGTSPTAAGGQFHRYASALVRTWEQAS